MSVACYEGRIGCPFFLAPFFFLFSFAFFALFFPLILRFISSSSILLRNTKTSLWSRRCKRQKQHPSGSGWYNECVRCDLKVYKKKQEKSGLENWLPCRRDLPTPPPPQLFISFYFAPPPLRSLSTWTIKRQHFQKFPTRLVCSCN